jgi:hypothetical protein
MLLLAQVLYREQKTIGYKGIFPFLLGNTQWRLWSGEGVWNLDQRYLFSKNMLLFSLLWRYYCDAAENRVK